MKKRTGLIIRIGTLFAVINIAMIGNVSAADDYYPVTEVVVHDASHHYDDHGFDSHGYNAHGYHRDHGYNQHGYNHHGHYNNHYDSAHH